VRARFGGTAGGYKRAFVRNEEVSFVENQRFPASMGPGTRVEVRSGYRSSWARGFEVAGVDGEQYRVRRVSDGAVLPATFEPAAVRQEKVPDEL